MKRFPKAIRISQWGSMTEIIYACPCCGQSFAALADRCNFCYNCGIEIDWDIIRSISIEQAEKYHSMDYSSQKVFLAEIDKCNGQQIN